MALTASAGAFSGCEGALMEELRLRRVMRKADTSSGRAMEPARAAGSGWAASAEALRGASGIPVQPSSNETTFPAV